MKIKNTNLLGKTENHYKDLLILLFKNKLKYNKIDLFKIK